MIKLKTNKYNLLRRKTLYWNKARPQQFTTGWVWFFFYSSFPSIINHIFYLDRSLYPTCC